MTLFILLADMPYMKWLVGILTIPNAMIGYFSPIILTTSLTIFAFIGILIQHFKLFVIKLDNLWIRKPYEESLKRSKRVSFCLNIKKFSQCVDEFEGLLSLSDKTNYVLSPFILVLFILCLLLIIAFSFIGASIIFLKFNIAVVFMVNLILYSTALNV